MLATAENVFTGADEADAKAHARYIEDQRRSSLFVRWLEAFWSMIRDESRKEIRPMLYEASYVDCFNRTRCDEHPVPVSPVDIAYELQAAHGFGLYYLPRKSNGLTFRWCASAEVVMAEYENNFSALADAIREADGAYRMTNYIEHELRENDAIADAWVAQEAAEREREREEWLKNLDLDRRFRALELRIEQLEQGK
jgi:hypothetical protein